MKSITDLVPDIYALMDGQIELDPKNVAEFSVSLSTMLMNRLSGRDDYTPSLRASNIGKPCERQLWYTINEPDKAEPLPPKVRLKFLFGDILEELLLFLAKEAGHDVQGEQDEIDVHGVKGHRDAVIDGMNVDVKSANARSFQGFEQGLQKSDPFHAANIEQLDFYLEGTKDDPLVTFKDVAGFLAFDKEKGGIALSLQRAQGVDWEKKVADKKTMLSSDSPPTRGYAAVPDGKSGNMKLQVACGYCPFRDHCWPDVRTFLYAGTPRHLTRVVRVPDVPELGV